MPFLVIIFSRLNINTIKNQEAIPDREKVTIMPSSAAKRKIVLNFSFTMLYEKINPKAIPSLDSLESMRKPADLPPYLVPSENKRFGIKNSKILIVIAKRVTINRAFRVAESIASSK